MRELTLVRAPAEVRVRGAAASLWEAPPPSPPRLAVVWLTYNM